MRYVKILPPFPKRFAYIVTKATPRHLGAKTVNTMKPVKCPKYVKPLVVSSIAGIAATIVMPHNVARCTQDCVIKAINDLTEAISLRLFRKYFSVLLTDLVYTK